MLFAFVEQRRCPPRLVTIVTAQWRCVHTSLLVHLHLDAGVMLRKGVRELRWSVFVVGGGKGPNFYQEVVMLLKGKSDFVLLCIGAQIQVITLYESSRLVSTVVLTLCARCGTTRRVTPPPVIDVCFGVVLLYVIL